MCCLLGLSAICVMCDDALNKMTSSVREVNIIGTNKSKCIFL